MNPPRPRLGWGFPAASALGALVLAVLLLPRTPGIGDSAEFTLALALAGIPHPTGYPLYVLLGHAFVVAIHALGASWVTAANLWSAIGSSLAAAGYARLVQELEAAGEQASEPRSTNPAPLRALMRALPVALLVFNPVWIESATVAEVYSWNHAWLAWAAAFAFGRLRRLEPGGPGDRRDDSTAAFRWGLLCGAGAAHHALAVFFAVPLSLALAAGLARAGRLRPSLLWPAAVGALLPLASLGWIAWRAAHPAAFQWPVEPNAASIWRHLRGAAYAGYVGRFAPRGPEWILIRGAVLPWLLPGIGAGAFWALRFPRLPTRWGLLALFAGAALVVSFIVSYGVPDPAMYFVPPLMVALLVALPASAWLVRRASPVVAVTLMLAVPLSLASYSVPRALADRVRLAGVDARIRAAWRSIPFDRGIVLWRDDHYHRLKLFQLLEGSRPELYVDSPNALTWRTRRTAFERRFGFDPLDGVEPRTTADVDRIPSTIRRLAPVPVTEFPEWLERVPRVRP